MGMLLGTAIFALLVWLWGKFTKDKEDRQIEYYEWGERRNNGEA